MVKLLLLLILTITVQSGLSNPLLTNITLERSANNTLIIFLKFQLLIFLFSRETPDDLTEGTEDVGTYDFTVSINWNYFWFAIIPIMFLLVGCLRRFCCARKTQSTVVDLAQPSQPQPQYIGYTASNAFTTNFSSPPPAQYNNGAFSPSEPSQPQMGFTSSFSYSSPGPATSSAGGFIQPPGYEEATRQPSVNQNFK